MDIEKTVANLKKNEMNAYFVKNGAEALELVKTLIPLGSTVTHGGSETLKECGVIDELNTGKYEYLDRSKPVTDEEKRAFYAATANADFFLMSANAITENGELYNVDGMANRISALAFGPKKIIVIAGKNKIVPTIEDAIMRVKTIAAPKNCRRLGIQSYCYHKGHCASLKPDFSGCEGDGRICCSYLVCAKQRYKGRITVVIVDEELGY